MQQNNIAYLPDELKRKDEISQLIDYLNKTPWPDGVEDARAHYDALGAEVAADIKVEKVTIGNISGQILTPPEYVPGRIMLYLHGGGFVFGSLKSHEAMVAEIARYAQCKVLQLDYRLAPEHPFPAALEDSCAAYKWILKHAYLPKYITIAGDSAGGGLVISTLLALSRDGIPLPAAAVCISPWTNQEFSGESYKTRQAIDPLIEDSVCKMVSALYLNGHSKRDPLVSPIYANTQGLPPFLIQVGQREVLYSDAEVFANNAQKAGVEVEFEEWPDMVHVWHLHYQRLSDGLRAIKRVGEYVISKTQDTD